MTTEDLEKAAAEVINGGRKLTPEERNQMLYEQLKRKDEAEEKLRQELIGKIIHFQTDDTLLTAEERQEKHKFLPTRIETKTGTWEIVGGYDGNNTLVGFRAKETHKYGSFNDNASSMILTVEQWLNVYDELEHALMLMVL